MRLGERGLCAILTFQKHVFDHHQPRCHAIPTARLFGQPAGDGRRPLQVQGRLFLTQRFKAGQPARHRNKDELKIEFLYWQDCPSHPGALQRLREVMAEIGDESLIEKIEVLTDDDAERLGFPGSPTIRVEGVDVGPAGALQMGASLRTAGRSQQASALTCRVYHLEDGRISPLPSKEMIRQALTGTQGGRGDVSHFPDS